MVSFSSNVWDTVQQPQRCSGPATSTHAERRAPRAAHSTRWAAAPGSLNTQQTSRSFLQTQHPVARLCAEHNPGALCSVSGQSPHTIHLVGALAPSPDPLLVKPLAGYTWAAFLLGLPTSSPAWDPHKAQRAGLPTHSLQTPVVAFPFTCSGEGLYLQESRAKADGRSEVPGSRSAGLNWRPCSR